MRSKFHNMSLKNYKIFTNKINKNCIEFDNDKRYINSLYENPPHVLKIEKSKIQQDVSPCS